MLNQILLILTLQVLLFISYNKLSFIVSKIINRRHCPICFATFTTWLILLLLQYFKIYFTNIYILTVLLTESVVGTSYLVEEFKLRHKISLSDQILKISILLYGTFAVMIFSVINQNLGLTIYAPIIIFGFYALTPNKINDVSLNSKEKSDYLKKKLENCC